MPKLHIVITDVTFRDKSLEESVLAPLDATVTLAHCRTEEEVLAIARDADALMVQFAPITRRVIEQLTRCRIISRYGVGVDMIDLAAAKERGIRVMNVPDFCVEEVASHTLCFILELGRKVSLQDRWMHQGEWQKVPALGPVERFSSQTLGLVALGRIGRRVAELAAPLGMRILGYDVMPPKDPGPVTLTDFETLVRESDYLSLHCPLTKETSHLINAEVLKKMKPTSFLINVARGGVVDTEALVEALANKQIAGAGLDVFQEEPLPVGHPLRTMENVILTPHTASYSKASRMQLRHDAARHVLDFFQREHK